MASLKAKSTIQNLLKKGFQQDNTHHHYYHFEYEGKRIASTFTSHNSQDIYDKLITAMSKQCRMDRQFFIEFAKCKKKQAEYIQHLKAKGEIQEENQPELNNVDEQLKKETQFWKKRNKNEK